MFGLSLRSSAARVVAASPAATTGAATSATPERPTSVAVAGGILAAVQEEADVFRQLDEQAEQVQELEEAKESPQPVSKPITYTPGHVSQHPYSSGPASSGYTTYGPATGTSYGSPPSVYSPYRSAMGPSYGMPPLGQYVQGGYLTEDARQIEKLQSRHRHEMESYRLKIESLQAQDQLEKATSRTKGHRRNVMKQLLLDLMDTLQLESVRHQVAADYYTKLYYLIQFPTLILSASVAVVDPLWPEEGILGIKSTAIVSIIAGANTCLISLVQLLELQSLKEQHSQASKLYAVLKATDEFGVYLPVLFSAADLRVVSKLGAGDEDTNSSSPRNNLPDSDRDGDRDAEEQLEQKIKEFIKDMEKKLSSTKQQVAPVPLFIQQKITLGTLMTNRPVEVSSGGFGLVSLIGDGICLLILLFMLGWGVSQWVATGTTDNLDAVFAAVFAFVLLQLFMFRRCLKVVPSPEVSESHFQLLIPGWQVLLALGMIEMWLAVSLYNVDSQDRDRCHLLEIALLIVFLMMTLSVISLKGSWLISPDTIESEQSLTGECSGFATTNLRLRHDFQDSTPSQTYSSPPPLNPDPNHTPSKTSQDMVSLLAVVGIISAGGYSYAQGQYSIGFAAVLGGVALLQALVFARFVSFQSFAPVKDGEIVITMKVCQLLVLLTAGTIGSGFQLTRACINQDHFAQLIWALATGVLMIFVVVVTRWQQISSSGNSTPGYYAAPIYYDSVPAQLPPSYSAPCSASPYQAPVRSSYSYAPQPSI